MRMRGRLMPWIALVLGLILPKLTLGASALSIKTTYQELSKKCRKVLAYDLPAQGRPALLEGLHGHFKEGWDFVDLATIPEARRASRLGPGFVLVTTFRRGGALLGAMLAKVGMAVPDADHVTVRGATVEAKDLRVLFVGENPFGPGPCLVLAARSNTAVRRLGSFLHNDVSGIVLTGQVTLSSLSYTRDFTSLPKAIPLVEAIKDVATCFDKLKRIHPDLLHKITLEEYLELQNGTFRKVAAAVAGDGTVRIRDLAAALYPALAAFGDGHTHVWWFFTPTPLTDPTTKFPPFVVRFDNGRWVVRKAVPGEQYLEGAAIDSVEGQPYTKFLQPVLSMISGETLPGNRSVHLEEAPSGSRRRPSKAARTSGALNGWQRSAA